MRRIIFFILLTISIADNVHAQDTEKMRDTIRYGTDTEITNIFKTLKAGNISELDDDLAALAEKSNNEQILIGVFSHFTDNEKTGLEDKALSILQNRDDLENKITVAAIDYLGSVKDKKSKDIMLEIISSDQSAYLSPAIKALGKIVHDSGSTEADKTAEYLIDYYNSKELKEDESRELIGALGNTGSKVVLPFLADIVSDTDVSAYLKAAALQAAAMLKDKSVLDTVLTACSSTDATVRTAAVSALGSFDDPKADAAIIDAFRDSFFRTRLSAVKSAGLRKLGDAVPYLRYRALNDDAASVREESIIVLGTIGSGESLNALLSILDDQKNNDKARVLCAEALLKNDPDQYCVRIIELMDESKQKRMNVLYSGFLKALSTAKSSKLEPLVARLYTSKDVTDNAIALDITANNNFTGFKDQVQKISETKNSTLASKAERILKSL
ncbi:MAG: hypothetical protein Ta2B_25520 [Termitinemataceae bacterium]|nr:MAG: hypothetical protein Ta2B_25520 [Termitinemataceae bacterium]